MEAYRINEIRRICGESAAAYARNKNRGGRSSAQGRDYELLYGTYRITMKAAKEVEAERFGDDIFFGDQLLCFVDDLVVQTAEGRVHSQLKSGGVWWNGGDHPVAEDFRLQKMLDDAIGAAPQYELVVSDADRRGALEDARPDDVAAVKVVMFSSDKSFDALATAHPELVDALDCISARREHRAVSREQMFQLLLGAWTQSTGSVNLRNFINKAAAAPLALVAPMEPPYIMPEEAAEVLSAIAGFSFEIHRNQFSYRIRGLSGYAAYHCHTKWFSDFVQFLLAKRPGTIEELALALRDERQ
ncbi:hypothetical protein JL100_003575 [Skermanella mucosa]|uniref:hypothetical protein n=1 Tax=Skermanella mucosa TaxID=1789672 RepID=UPI00192B4FDD|nr:hypothetical protein [Skermanella mucosa]UEM21860.1 hypothetical protein JL100_003575 [Skermanella mucosa]